MVIGTCSLCGGAVEVPEAWYGLVSPLPTCRSCGARKKAPHGPVVEMENPVECKGIHPDVVARLRDQCAPFWKGDGWRDTH